MMPHIILNYFIEGAPIWASARDQGCASEGGSQCTRRRSPSSRSSASTGSSQPRIRREIRVQRLDPSSFRARTLFGSNLWSEGMEDEVTDRDRINSTYVEGEVQKERFENAREYTFRHISLFRSFCKRLRVARFR